MEWSKSTNRASPLESQYLVDVNRAEWPEFVLLPAIGETLARRIVEDRQTNGEFRDVDDLERVTGIGPRTLERIRPYLFPIPKDTDWASTDLGPSPTAE